MTRKPTNTEMAMAMETLRRATERIAELDAERNEQTTARREAVSVLRARAWTLQAIADEIGISKAAIAQIERASR